MKQFSEASTCRRKILLSYFGRVFSERIAVIAMSVKIRPNFLMVPFIAQKILSTIARLKEG